MVENDHVISGLMKKREELVTSLEYHGGEVLKFGAAIASVDATIRLYDPEFMPESGPLRSAGRSNRHFKTGEAPVLILDYMRDHKGPQPTTEIVRHIAAIKGVNRDTLTEHQFQAFYNLLSKTIKRLGTNGTLKESHRVTVVIFWEVE